MEMDFGTDVRVNLVDDDRTPVHALKVLFFSLMRDFHVLLHPYSRQYSSFFPHFQGSLFIPNFLVPQMILPVEFRTIIFQFLHRTKSHSEVLLYVPPTLMHLHHLLQIPLVCSVFLLPILLSLR